MHLPLEAYQGKSLLSYRSSLKTLIIGGHPFSVLDSMDALSDNISTLHLQFQSFLAFSKQYMANPSEVKYGTKLSHILRRNSSLKELQVSMPLDKDEVHDILHSLEDNHTLEKLELLKHGYTYSVLLRKMGMSTFPTQSPANLSGVKGGTKLSIHNFLRRNTSLKHLTLFLELDEDELHDIVVSLKDNHTLERLELPHEFHSVCSSMSIEEPRICRKDMDDFYYIKNYIYI